MWFRATLLSLLVATDAGTPPIAPHILAVVQPGKDVVVRLTGFDLDGDKLTAKIASVPASGTLTQLSAVFSDYGYEPKAGRAIADAGVSVTGSNNRVVYKRPENDVAPEGKWAQFTYTVSESRTSLPGTVTLVPPSGVLVASSFTHGPDGWTVEGNVGTSALPMAVSWEPSSRGALLNRYVYATDSIINVDAAGDDATRWYFAAPAPFLGNQGVSYGGALEFSLGAFSGEFDAASANAARAHLVELECATCATNAGVTLAFPVSALAQRFDGAPTQFSLPLSETAGWVKDPKNTLKQWWRPSKCEMIEVLSGLSAVRILGDFSRWYESVALDGVQLVQRAGSSLVPVCAQGTPDASLCTCAD